ncbi:MAG: STAS/SEC14 domain-containing protein [Planctomycetota bacterium]
MAVELTEELDGKLVCVGVTGTLAKQDYEHFVPEIERLVRKHGKVDILLTMHDFHGWSAGALWEDIKFDLKHFLDIRRLAIVGETDWEKWMASFCKPFTNASIRYFKQDQAALARLWVLLKDDKAAHVIPHNRPAAFGIYTTLSGVEKAVEQLRNAAFTPHEISVLLPHKSEPPHADNTKFAVGSEVGASTGAVVGGVLGWLAGVGLLSIPGMAAEIIGGPIVTAFISAVTLASLGGIWGGLVGLGIPEKEGRHYEGRLHKGDILLSVHCDQPERIMTAKEIMLHTGAEDIYARQDAAGLGQPAHATLSTQT